MSDILTRMKPERVDELIACVETLHQRKLIDLQWDSAELVILALKIEHMHAYWMTCLPVGRACDCVATFKGIERVAYAS